MIPVAGSRKFPAGISRKVTGSEDSGKWSDPEAEIRWPDSDTVFLLPCSGFSPSFPIGTGPQVLQLLDYFWYF
jgi:hypothetical protein